MFHYVTIDYIALHCVALRCVTLDYITLHYILTHTHNYLYIYLQAPPAHIKIDGIDWMCNPEKYGVIGFYPNR